MAIRFYAGEPVTVSAGPSAAIWASCPVAEMLEDPSVGYYLFDDFLLFEEDNHGWVKAGTNPTCTIPATNVGGVIQLGASSADNDEGYLTSGNNEGGFCKISATSPKKLWFEARVKVASVADQGVFAGLSEEALAAAETLADDSGALASKDFVGFHAATATPTILNAVYRKAGETAVTHVAAKTIAAATWYKVGFVFDETNLQYYVNGDAVGTLLKISTATTFPDGEELAILFGVKTGEAVAKTMDIDWVRLAQLR